MPHEQNAKAPLFLLRRPLFRKESLRVLCVLGVSAVNVVLRALSQYLCALSPSKDHLNTPPIYLAQEGVYILIAQIRLNFPNGVQKTP